MESTRTPTNNAEALTSTATAAVVAPPLTVSLENAATSHDGSAAFTFEIRFSEEFGLSYQILRDHAFTVTDGEVLRSQRMDRPSNILWRITVQPDSNGDVTIVLPVTTYCSAQGAICTQDGRKLSNALNFTVSGPGGYVRRVSGNRKGRTQRGGAIRPSHKRVSRPAQLPAPTGQPSISRVLPPARAQSRRRCRQWRQRGPLKPGRPGHRFQAAGLRKMGIGMSMKKRQARLSGQA